VKFRATNPKITDSHMARVAVIYIRQSTVRQVVEHKASGTFQRSLADLARQYGWPDELIVVVDQDQGRSGTSTIGREGFKWLRLQIFEERVGAIICWDASRIGRDNAALAQLIKLCAATNTLIIDEKGVYDPNNDNDRIFLGLINILVDAEGRRFADRSVATRRTNAAAGVLRLMPPTGYVYDDNNKLIIDPDKKVQAAIRLFFEYAERYGSASQVVKRINREGIKFPTREKGCGKDRAVSWDKININRALDMMRNPTFAGTYAYGLTKLVNEMLSADSAEQHKKRVAVSLDSDEVILIHGAHEGYITWDTFIENRRRLKENRFIFADGPSGAARNGPALLQGRIECGHCRHGMYAAYFKAKGHPGSSYRCTWKKSTFGEQGCLNIDVSRLDQAVTKELLDALSPSRIQMTLQNFSQVADEAKAEGGRQDEALKCAQAEVDEAKRRFKSIDPQYDLVAKEYQKELQDKLLVVKRLEAQQARSLKTSSRKLPKRLQHSLLQLGKEVRKVWECAAVTNVERKMLLRQLIAKVTVKKEVNKQYLVEIHWVTGAVTPLSVMFGQNHLPEAGELMRRMAPDHTVRQIVDELNQAGYKPVRGDRFTIFSVTFYLKRQGMKVGCPELKPGSDEPRGDGRFSAQATARMLNISRLTVARWCASGILDAIRSTPRGAFWIKISPEQVSKLKKVRREGVAGSLHP
jgi:DNA invertase Pin-like site-specific DNA recombinase